MITGIIPVRLGMAISASTVTIYERGTGITGNHQVRSFGVCAS